MSKVSAPSDRVGSVEGEWNKFRKATLHGYADGIDVLVSLDFVLQANTPAVTASIDRADAGRSARIMREALMERILLKVVRAYSKTIWPDDHHTKVAIEFLRRRGVLEEQTNQDQRTVLESAIAEFDRLATDERLLSISRYRDKSLAHIGLPDDTMPPPMAVDLFDFARETCRLWESLRLGADPHTLPMEFHVSQYRASTAVFWARWDE